jgi:hypothetical protein
MPIQYYIQTMACNTTLASTAVKFDGGARNVIVFVPSAASGTDVLFQVSYDGTTYGRLKFPVLSGTAVPGNVTIGSAVTQCGVPVNELKGARYLKVEHTTAIVAAACTYNFIVEY